MDDGGVSSPNTFSFVKGKYWQDKAFNGAGINQAKVECLDLYIQLKERQETSSTSISLRLKSLWPSEESVLF